MTTSRSALGRRGAGALAVAALSLGALAAVPAPAQAAAGDPDPGPLAVGAGWLAGQVPTDTYVYETSYDFGSGPVAYPDQGVTIDAATSLSAIGARPGLVAKMTDAVSAQADDYTFGGTAANANAKLAAFLLQQGRRGVVVEDTLEDVAESVSTTSPIAGRIEDAPSDFGDFASPIGQAYAVAALEEAGNTSVLQSAKDFLFAQQCVQGYFRESFTADKGAVDQTCDGAPAGQKTASIDTTALVVLALADSDDAEMGFLREESLNWLGTRQARDGSFDANANSTGLAAQALATGGFTGKAERAAGWLRAHQLANAGTCRPYAASDSGAIVVDDLGVANAAAGKMDAVDRGVAFRATAQALPGLALADGGRNAGRTFLSGVPAYVRGDTRDTVKVVGAPGNSLCFNAGGVKKLVVLPASGTKRVQFHVPGGTRKVGLSTVDAAGRTAKIVVQGLAPTTLTSTVASRLKIGSRAPITVSGLASGERVTVSLRGTKVTTGRANDRGVFTGRFAVTGPAGRAGVLVTGAFGNRRDQTSVSVVR